MQKALKIGSLFHNSWEAKPRSLFISLSSEYSFSLLQKLLMKVLPAPWGADNTWSEL
jgi:hypothetical protein